MKKNKAIDISVVIPVYNELPNIERLITKLCDTLQEAGYRFELIFVDDSSTDGTFEYLQRFSKSQSVVLSRKKGDKGKSFSLLEGFALAKGDAVVMIDADLQYPPEAIPAMIRKLARTDIVVANRKRYHDNLLRKLFSKTFQLLVGRILFQLPYDIQSGLKVFKRDVAKTITFIPRSGWTFDLEFLQRARYAGFQIVNHDITFRDRRYGQSKINHLSAIIEIGVHALRMWLTRVQPVQTNSDGENMQGAGIRCKKRAYVTHTTLPYHLSAVQTFVLSQKLFLLVVFLCVVAGFLFHPFFTLSIIIAILSAIYFFDVLFNLFIVLKSLYIPQEIQVSPAKLDSLLPSDLPIYTILCPLYHEAHIIPQFLDSIAKLDWPKNKLDVLLLLEEDDKKSINAVENMDLPAYVSAVIVPDTQPKTKPKACNYGLSLAKGEYLVIYDAEDIPDPLQLKKSYLVFQRVGKDVICLQAKLNYFNSQQNLLTRLFTAEYSLWFDVTLTGLQSVKTSLPLGGTSNHFRTADLRMLEGWDPFNVTEDADLGIRLFNAGYKTAIIDSTTLEEANSQVKNWIRQRSRWIKGYMQTYLVHMRKPKINSLSDLLHFFYFQMAIGGKIAFILINPFLWVATISYFTLYAYVGPTIEALYPSIVFYMALISLVFGNFLFIYYYMIGCIKREQYGLVKYIFLVPVYWILISIAGFVALYQLFFKPHYWEKTIHGLHLKKENNRKNAEVNVQLAPAFAWPIRFVINLFI